MSVKRHHIRGSWRDAPGRPRSPVLATGLTIALWRLVRRFSRVEVVGLSMRPSLEPGDRLLVRSTRRLKAGQVVAVTDPRDPGRVLVKRITSVGPFSVEVRGDDPLASTDSRHFGPVARSAVRGRAIYRYHPPERAGRPGGRGWLPS